MLVCNEAQIARVVNSQSIPLRAACRSRDNEPCVALDTGSSREQPGTSRRRIADGNQAGRRRAMRHKCGKISAPASVWAVVTPGMGLEIFFIAWQSALDRSSAG